MQSLLTASIVFTLAAYALLVTVQFLLGIFALWQRSQPVTSTAAVSTLMLQTIIKLEMPEVKLGVVTLPTAEAELLATFAPELVSPQAVVMPIAEALPIENLTAMATPAAGIAPVSNNSTSSLELLTIRQLKRLASSVGVKNYSILRKNQLIEQILAKESSAA